MGKAITPEMVDLFNTITSQKYSVVRLKQNGRYVHITVEDPYLKTEDQTFVVTEEFYDEVNEFFAEEDVEIMYNNTRSTFFAINVGKDE